jgi:hypothetical protein
MLGHHLELCGSPHLNAPTIYQVRDRPVPFGRPRLSGTRPMKLSGLLNEGMDGQRETSSARMSHGQTPPRRLFYLVSSDEVGN